MSYRVAVAVSGRGSNLRALLQALHGRPGAKVVLVLSNRAEAGGLATAREYGIPTAVFADPADADAWLTALGVHRVDLLVLAGYLKLVPAAVVRTYAGRIINIHPALLPRHGGPGMYGDRVHRAVLAAGDPESGATVHLVDEEYDRGATLAQAVVPVLPGDSPATLAERVLAVEHRLLPAAVRHAALAGGDEELRGLSGQRFYFVIDSGLHTEHFKTTLRRALILKGFVWHQVSKSGSLLERFPFDLAVYQASRLDFAAGPHCPPPLEWRPVPWRVWNEGGPLLSLPAAPEISEADRRRIEHTVNESRRARKPESRAVREQWIEDTGRTVALHHQDLDPEQARAIAREAVERGVLAPQFILTDQEGTSVTVGELMSNPQEHHGRRFHDPLEPDYRNDPRIAVFLVDDRGRARVFSHAHGGQWWRCGGRVVQVRLGLLHESVASIKAGLEEDTCDLYRHGDAIVEVDSVECRMRPLEADGLALRGVRRGRGPRPTSPAAWHLALRLL